MLAVLGKLAYARGFATGEILQYRFGIGAVLLLIWFAALDRSVLRASPKTLLKAVFLGAALYPVQSIAFMACRYGLVFCSVRRSLEPKEMAICSSTRSMP